MKGFKGLAAALMAVTLVAGQPAHAEADSNAKAKHKLERKQATANGRAHRHAKPKPFDENEYYERVLRFIPFGTSAWWRQLQDETGGDM